MHNLAKRTHVATKLMQRLNQDVYTVMQVQVGLWDWKVKGLADLPSVHVYICARAVLHCGCIRSTLGV